jgi:hypothetical protein
MLFLTIKLRQLKASVFRYLACSMGTVQKDNVLFFDCYKSGYYGMFNF